MQAIVTFLEQSAGHALRMRPNRAEKAHDHPTDAPKIRRDEDSFNTGVFTINDKGGIRR